MRLFVAIPIAETASEELARLVLRLRRSDDELRWSAPESWHITLQFLGAASAAQYDCLRDSLGEISAEPFEVRLGELGFFERAGIYHVAVQGSAELAALQQKVVAATARCEFIAEQRVYRPHITLARNRGRGTGIRDLKARVSSAAQQFPAFTAREFLLYESHLGAGGSRYEVRERIGLGQRE